MPLNLEAPITEGTPVEEKVSIDLTTVADDASPDAKMDNPVPTNPESPEDKSTQERNSKRQKTVDPEMQKLKDQLERLRQELVHAQEEKETALLLSHRANEQLIKEREEALARNSMENNLTLLEGKTEQELKEFAEQHRQLLIQAERMTRQRNAEHLVAEITDLKEESKALYDELKEIETLLRTNETRVRESFKKKAKLNELLESLKKNSRDLMSEASAIEETAVVLTLQGVIDASEETNALLATNRNFTFDYSDSPMYSPLREQEHEVKEIQPPADIPPLEPVPVYPGSVIRAERGIRIDHPDNFRYRVEKKWDDRVYADLKQNALQQRGHFVLRGHLEHNEHHLTLLYRKPAFRFICPKGYFCRENALGSCAQFHTLREHCVHSFPAFLGFSDDDLHNPTDEVNNQIKALAICAARWYPAETDRYLYDGKKLFEDGSIFVPVRGHTYADAAQDGTRRSTSNERRNARAHDGDNGDRQRRGVHWQDGHQRDSDANHDGEWRVVRNRDRDPRLNRDRDLDRDRGERSGSASHNSGILLGTGLSTRLLCGSNK